MIHLLEIGPETSPIQVKKLLRRFAMTGGVELSLKASLTESELRAIAEQFIPVCLAQAPGSSVRRASAAGRILSQILDCPEVNCELKHRIEQVFHVP